MVKVYTVPDNYSPLLCYITYGIFIFSAGGLSTYIHVDYFRSRIPKDIPVNAMADAGYVCTIYFPCMHLHKQHTQRIPELS